MEHFQEVKPNRFIFTKTDEATTYGTILNIISKYKVPISYVTTGQNVPEDIEVARPERIAKLLLTKPTVNRTIPLNSEPTAEGAAPAASGDAVSPGASPQASKEKPDAKSTPTETNQDRNPASGKDSSEPGTGSTPS